jgi:hypothetical protein
MGIESAWGAALITRHHPVSEVKEDWSYMAHLYQKAKARKGLQYQPFTRKDRSAYGRGTWDLLKT